MSSDEEYFVNLSCNDSNTESDESSENDKSNDGCIKPYNFEPYLSDNETNASNSDSDVQDKDVSNAIPADLQRLQNTEWSARPSPPRTTPLPLTLSNPINVSCCFCHTRLIAGNNNSLWCLKYVLLSMVHNLMCLKTRRTFDDNDPLNNMAAESRIFSSRIFINIGLTFPS